MNRTIKLFYFEADPSGSRMGTSLAYVLGLDEKCEVYSNASDAPPKREDLVPGEVVMERRRELDNTSMIRRLRDGKRYEDFQAEDVVDAGMGNLGVCVGEYPLLLEAVTP